MYLFVCMLFECEACAYIPERVNYKYLNNSFYEKVYTTYNVAYIVYSTYSKCCRALAVLFQERDESLLQEQRCLFTVYLAAYRA